MTPKISFEIIICTYNNAELLDKTLSAIALQDVSEAMDWKVLVVDNNCIDQTPQVIQNHIEQNKFPLRRIVEKTQGLTPARVCGVKNSEAEWIAFVDDDCILEPDWLGQAAEFIREHPNCGGFGGKIILEWIETPPAFLLKHPYAFAGANHGDKVKPRDWLAGAGMIVQRDALASTGWIEKQFLQDRIGKHLVSGGDVEISLRLAAQYQLWYNPKCRLRHLIPPRRMTREYLRKMLFGLGASRHNSHALKWKGSYPSWLVYSIIYGAVYFLFGLFNFIKDKLSNANADLKISVNPALGWMTAVKQMLQMNRGDRNLLLGCAVKKQLQ